MYSQNKISWWLYGVGLIIVVGTHVSMLVLGLPAEQVMAHSVLNLLAGVLLMTGWLKR